MQRHVARAGSATRCSARNRVGGAQNTPPIRLTGVWNEPDEFGVPANMFGFVPEDFIRGIGRIVMTAALVENVFSHVVMTLMHASEDAIAGWQSGRLLEKFDHIARVRTPSPRLLEVRTEFEDLMDRRNELVHSLWPFHGGLPPRGWRPVTPAKRGEDGDHIVWVQPDIDDLKALIGRLVALHRSLGDLFNSGDLN